MIYSGEICDIDDARGYVKVDLKDIGIVTEWIPLGRLFNLGNTQSVPIEMYTQVLVCETYTRRWFVLCATPNSDDVPYAGSNRNKWGVKFKDGTLIEYDIAAHKLVVNGSAIEVDITAAQVAITAPIITLTGEVTIDGALIASAGLAVSGGDIAVSGADITTDGNVTAGAVSLASHLHSGVQTGLGTSGPPV